MLNDNEFNQLLSGLISPEPFIGRDQDQAKALALKSDPGLQAAVAGEDLSVPYKRQEMLQAYRMAAGDNAPMDKQTYMRFEDAISKNKTRDELRRIALAEGKTKFTIAEFQREANRQASYANANPLMQLSDLAAKTKRFAVEGIPNTVRELLGYKREESPRDTAGEQASLLPEKIPYIGCKDVLPSTPIRAVSGASQFGGDILKLVFAGKLPVIGKAFEAYNKAMPAITKGPLAGRLAGEVARGIPEFAMFNEAASLANVISGEGRTPGETLRHHVARETVDNLTERLPETVLQAAAFKTAGPLMQRIFGGRVKTPAAETTEQVIETKPQKLDPIEVKKHMTVYTGETTGRVRAVDPENNSVLVKIPGQKELQSFDIKTLKTTDGNPLKFKATEKPAESQAEPSPTETKKPFIWNQRVKTVDSNAVGRARAYKDGKVYVLYENKAGNPLPGKGGWMPLENVLDVSGNPLKLPDQIQRVANTEAAKSAEMVSQKKITIPEQKSAPIQGQPTSVAAQKAPGSENAQLTPSGSNLTEKSSARASRRSETAMDAETNQGETVSSEPLKPFAHSELIGKPIEELYRIAEDRGVRVPKRTNRINLVKSIVEDQELSGSKRQIVDRAIDKVLDEGLNDPSANKRIIYRTVGPEEAERLSRAGYSLEGLRHSLDTDHAYHIWKNHAERTWEPGEIKLTRDDFHKIPEITSEPTMYGIGRPIQEGKSIVYIKEGGGHAFLVESVGEKSGLLVTRTIKKFDSIDSLMKSDSMKGVKLLEQDAGPRIDPLLTSETDQAGNISISQENKEVKPGESAESLKVDGIPDRIDGKGNISLSDGSGRMAKPEETINALESEIRRRIQSQKDSGQIDISSKNNDVLMDGSLRITRGDKDYAEWSKGMTRDYGPIEENTLKDLWTESRKRSFVPHPDGGYVYTYFDEDMAKAMGTTPKPLLFQVGFQDPVDIRKGFGLSHVDYRHLPEVRDRYNKSTEYLADATNGFNEIWRQANGRFMLVKKNGAYDRTIVEVDPKSGLFFTADNVFSSSNPKKIEKEFAKLALQWENTGGKKGAKKVWERRPLSATPGDRSAPNSGNLNIDSSGNSVNELQSGETGALGRDSNGSNISIDDISDKIKPELNPESTVKDGGGSSAANRGVFTESFTTSPATIQALPSVEMLDLAKQLTNDKVFVKRMPKSLGLFTGKDSDMSIKISPKTVEKSDTQLLNTLAHEAGHAIDYVPDNTLSRGNVIGHLKSIKNYIKNTFPLLGPTNKEFRQELMDLSAWWRPLGKEGWTAYRKSPKELYADAVSVLLNAPNELKTRAPKFFQAFIDNMGRKPEAKAAYDNIQKFLKQTPEQISEARRTKRHADYRKGYELQKKAEEEKGENDIGAFEALKTALFNKYNAANRIKAKIEARVGKGNVTADMDPVVKFNEFMYRDASAQAFLSKVAKETHKPILDAGVTPEDMGDYMRFKRITEGDRSKIINPDNYTATEAAKELRMLEKRLGEKKTAVMKKAEAKFQDRVFEIMEQAHDEGIISDQVWKEKILPNRGKYATYTTLDHIAEEPTGTIKSQIGTFKSIGNPYEQTIFKTLATQRLIEIQKVKRQGVIDPLTQFAPNEIKKHPFKFDRQGEPTPEPGKGIVPILENGRMEYYEVDKYIADMFNRRPEAESRRLVELMNKVNYGIFHNLYVKYNPSFQVHNPIRDIKRSYINMPTQKASDLVMDMVRLLKNYHQVKGQAKSYIKGEPGPLAQKMLEEKALSGTFISGVHDETDSLLRLLDSRGITVGQSGKTKERGIVSRFLNKIEQYGETLEVRSKMAAYKTLGEKGITGAERADLVRNKMGTPNFKQKGTASPSLNALAMYTNIQIQGLASDLAVGLNPKTAFGWWMKTAATELMPKVVMKAGQIGLLGEAVKAMYDKIPDYHLRNYIVIPLFMRKDEKTGEEKAVAIRLPHADTARPFAGAFWAAMNADKKGFSADWMQNILSIGYGQLPTFSPGIKIPMTLGAAAAGYNPVDEFRGKEIVGKDAWESRSLDAGPMVKDLAKWTGNQLGLASDLVRPLIGSSWDNQKGVIEKAISGTPGISRLLLITNAGDRETDDQAIDEDKAQDAFIRLRRPQAVRQLDGEYNRLNAIPEEKLNDKQLDRKFELKQYNRIIAPLKKRLKNAIEDKDNNEVKVIQADMEEIAKEYNGTQ